MTIPPERIRNFAIVAHIDHGKSTLADRLIERTGGLSDREMREQVLDRMDLERERGITIKAQSCTLEWADPQGERYVLNLIDTPGHVDFHYEVSRSLQACEGALLVVDAAQGVEAQTLANVYLALEADLEIVPVINKIDLPGADPEAVLRELEEGVGLDVSGAVLCSAKTGEGVDDVIEAIVRRVPPPRAPRDAPLRALVVDSWFDPYVGVIAFVRVVEGRLRRGDEILLMSTGARHEVTGVGVFTPEPVAREELAAGMVGYVVAGIKRITDARVGDTITHVRGGAAEPLPGFREVKPMVFAGLYPVDARSYGALRDSLEKLALNDAALAFEPETSDALGFGFRAGFLGLLHMEIVQERLEREFELELVTTAPSVVYRVRMADGSEREIHSPSQLPPPGRYTAILEPVARVVVHVPDTWLGPIMQLCQERRGVQVGFEVPTQGRAVLTYDIPYAEIVYDFFDRLKSLSRGYASMDYEVVRWEEADLVKLDMLLNGELVDALSIIVHRDAAYRRGQQMARKLKEFIPRQMFDVAIQAAIGSRVIARTTVKALRKDVTAKCYGGDISRKRKLLERQKEGKRRMKAVGSVEVPQEAFLAVLKIER